MSGRKAAKRQAGGGGAELASCVRMGMAMAVPVREGVEGCGRVGQWGWGWIGQPRGVSGGVPRWCVAGLEKLPGSRGPVAVAMDGLAVDGWMDALDG